MDGDVGEVNPELMRKVANTSAEDWKEERKRAIRARILSNKATVAEPKSAESSAKYLPKYNNDLDEQGPGGKRSRDGPDAVAQAASSSSGAGGGVATGGSFSPAAANAVRSLVAQAGFSSSAPSAAAATPAQQPTATTVTPAPSSVVATPAAAQAVRPAGRVVAPAAPEASLKQRLLKRIQEMKVAAEAK